MCRVGAGQLDAGTHARILLIDSDDPAANPNLDTVLADLASDIARWRDEGKSVLVHCVYAERRTPAVAAAYLAHRQNIGAGEAWERVCADLPGARVNRSFRSALERLWPDR